MDIVFTILVAVAVIAIAAMLFLGWMVVKIVNLILRTVFRQRPSERPTGAIVHSYQWAVTRSGQCLRDNCRHANPPEAQFCRHCGMNLVEARIAPPPRIRRRELVRA